MDHRVRKIGVFYDGSYVFQVRNYYKRVHERHGILDFNGLHTFVKQEIARIEGLSEQELSMCKIVDAHFFQGRRSAHHSDAEALRGERAFDEMLSRMGVTTHYLPLQKRGSYEMEKGIDVWLALEALEQSYYKHYDFVVLLAGDGDYLPLLRKLNAFGIRVMLLFWEFEYEDDRGGVRYTSASDALKNEATYPMDMVQVCNSPKGDILFSNDRMRDADSQNEVEEYEGVVLSVGRDYGFIKQESFPDNVFFLTKTVEGDVQRGDRVTFAVEVGQNGNLVAKFVRSVK